MQDKIKIGDFICDRCGQEVKQGVATVSEHQFNCPSAETIKINDTFSYTIHKPLSLTQIESQNNIKP